MLVPGYGPSNPEEWKDIPGYFGYQVSNRGNIRSRWKPGSKFMRSQWRSMTPRQDGNGYFVVTLKKEPGKFEKCHIHRLVLLGFVGPCPNGMCCRHINGELNNDLENLEWNTPSRNVKDVVRDGMHPWSSRSGEQPCQAKLTEESVRVILHLRDSGRMSYQEVSKVFDVTPEAIRFIWRRKRWSHVPEPEEVT